MLSECVLPFPALDEALTVHIKNPPRATLGSSERHTNECDQAPALWSLTAGAGINRNTVLARFEGQILSVINLAYIPTKYELLYRS